MTQPEKQVGLLQMLAANEVAIGKLYETYGNKFPEHEEFWFGLAMEEADHANWIHDLTLKVNKKSLSVYEGLLKTEDIQTFRNYLSEQLNNAKKGEISFFEALSTALNIEKSLIESQYFRVFTGGSEEDWNILEYLASATANHIKVIQNQLEQYNTASG